MVRSWVLVPVLLMSAQAAPAQSNSQGVSTSAPGSSSMCGFTGTGAQDLIKKIRDSRELTQYDIHSERFDLFQSADTETEWVVTKPASKAYPAVTCIHVYRKLDGKWQQDRETRCEASQDACNEMATEFREVDERLRTQLAKVPDTTPPVQW